MKFGLPRRLAALTVLVSAGCAAGTPAPSNTASDQASVAPFAQPTDLAEQPPTEPESESPTSLDLIDEAVAEGTIDEETAIAYKLYYLFGDGRLPAEYSTPLDPESYAGEGFLRDLRANFAQLSPDAQETVGPYLVQPFYEGSWWDLQAEAALLNTRRVSDLSADVNFGPASSDPPTPCSPAIECEVSDQWTSIVSGNDMVRIWYPIGWEGGADQAARARAELDAVIWPELTAVAGREPKSDEGYAGGGIDGRIDISLVGTSGGSHVEDLARPFATCQDTAGYMMLFGGFSRGVLAHELMHLIEFAFPAQGDPRVCESWDWIDEGVGNWAESVLYPGFGRGDAAGRRFVNQLEFSLDYADDAREYGTWLFWYYLSTQHGPAVIGDIYRARASQADDLKAIDQVIPGGFSENWKDFVLHAWNRDPVTHFQDWVDFQGSPEQLLGTLPPMDLDGEVDQLIELEDLVLEPLSAWHLHFTVPDEVRSIGFYNGLAYTLELTDTESGSLLLASPNTPDSSGLHIWAIRKVNGEWQEPEDWTLFPDRYACTEVPAERIEEIVLIFSNSEFANRTRKLRATGAPTTLFASNYGCARWEGEISWSYEDETTVESIRTRDLVFERATSIATGTLAEYSVASGTLDWDLNIVHDQCTTTGSGHGLRIDNQASSLMTMNWILSGEQYRAATASLLPAEEQTAVTNCPGLDPEVPWPVGIGLGLPMPFVVDDQGSTFSGSHREEGVEVTWHFETVRD